MIEKTCPRRGCGKPYPVGTGQRAAHDAQYHPGLSALKATGSTSRWRRLRLLQLVSYPVCESEDCTKAACIVDHFTPRWEGGDDDPANLVSLCKSHNKLKTQGVQLRLRPRRRGAAPTFA